MHSDIKLSVNDNKTAFSAAVVDGVIDVRAPIATMAIIITAITIPA